MCQACWAISELCTTNLENCQSVITEGGVPLMVKICMLHEDAFLLEQVRVGVGVFLDGQQSRGPAWTCKPLVVCED